MQSDTACAVVLVCVVVGIAAPRLYVGPYAIGVRMPADTSVTVLKSVFFSTGPVPLCVEHGRDGSSALNKSQAH